MLQMYIHACVVDGTICEGFEIKIISAPSVCCSNLYTRSVMFVLSIANVTSQISPASSFFSAGENDTSQAYNHANA